MQSAVAISSGFRASDAARVWLVPLLVGLGVYLLICVDARTVLGDGDTLTHIVVGRWILEHWRDPVPGYIDVHGAGSDLGAARMAGGNCLRRGL